jgi:hypothetical protein
MESEHRTVDQLLQALDVTVAFGVETGRVPFGAGDLAQDRRYFARSGTRQLTISRDQMEALRGAGSPGKDVGVLRSFQNAEHATFSNHCPGCQRWIHLGSTDHAGDCFCGQAYRVIFDLSPEDWSLCQEMRCMDCGLEMTKSLAGPGLNSWHPINGHQVQCDVCALKRLATQASEASARARLT